jgi:hypothetical protein
LSSLLYQTCPLTTICRSGFNLHDLRDHFERWDEDGSGEITAIELAAAMSDLGEVHMFTLRPMFICSAFFINWRENNQLAIVMQMNSQTAEFDVTMIELSALNK